MNIYDHTIDIFCPSCVFGDGSHETTRFLLYYLNRYVNGKTYIDAGCGTGILSVFAYKCGAASVTAVDIDGNAIHAARNNAMMNKAEVELIHGDVSDVEQTADIVTANFPRFDVLYLLPRVTRLAKDMIITTWYKEVPKDILGDYKVVDCIEGVDYDCYVLRIQHDNKTGVD